MTGEDELAKQVREMSRRIAELEGALERLTAPMREMESAARGYYRLVDLALRHGSISPEMLIPEVKDPISRDIVRALINRSGQNTTQITEAVRSMRGTASRRIIRERLSSLKGRGIIDERRRGAIPEYHLSEEVVRKWSQLLGIKI